MSEGNVSEDNPVCSNSFLRMFSRDGCGVIPNRAPRDLRDPGQLSGAHDSYIYDDKIKIVMFT